jgi:DNA primase
VSTITRESLEALEAAVDMVDLVGGRTPLRRSGARYVGRCPFHDERTPSFSVDPVKMVYYCFGCQRGGDHIAFVRETENLDFAAAVETLADRYGVRLEYEQSSPAEERRRAERGRLLRLLEDAAGFYARYLWESAEAAPARDYLAERGIVEATARDHRLGFSPSAWDRVCAAALAKGFSAAELGQAGLSGRGRRGPVDRFRGRLMFPLADVRGRVRGFGARQMPGGEPPKYLNSPEGPLFHKADVLYGLDRARGAIAAAGHAIVVEGYTDVLALHQAGTANAVASMGTALTDGQVTELRRVCAGVSLAFDADAAGEEASLRGMALAEAKGLSVRVVSLPPGQDPADVVLADPGAFASLLESAAGVLSFRVGRALALGGTRDEMYARASGVIAASAPSVERDEQVRLVADRLRLTDDLTARLTNARPAAPAAAPQRPQGSARLRRSPWEQDGRLFLGMALALPERGRELLAEMDVAYFPDEPLREAAGHIRRLLAGEGESEDAERWAPRMAELNAVAAREAPSESALEELYWKLHLHRTEDELKTSGQNADLELSQQQELQRLEELRLRLLATLESVRAHAPDR